MILLLIKFIIVYIILKKVISAVDYYLNGSIDMVNSGKDGKIRYDTAIVIGQSWSGLITARVLLNHFKKVVIIDKDDIENEITEFGSPSRKSIVQINQLHVISVCALDAVKVLFPKKFLEIFQHYGGTLYETGQMKYFHDGWLKDKFVNSMAGASTRQYMESVVRHLLFKIYGDRIEILSGVLVKGLITENKKVLGVRLTRFSDDDDEQKCDEKKNKDIPTSIKADFIVDCSGKHSRTKKWLNKQCNTTVKKLSYDPRISYSTTVFKVKEGTKASDIPREIDDIVTLVYGEGSDYLAIFISHNGTFTYLSNTYNGKPVSTNLEDLWSYHKKLPKAFLERYDMDAVVHYLKNHCDVVKTKDTTRQITPGAFSFNLFHQAENLPSNFAVVGDAYCCVNPVFGQGTSLAAIEAGTLDSVLRQQQNLANVGKLYFKKVYPRIRYVWEINLGFDYRRIGVAPISSQDKERIVSKFFQWFTKTIMDQAKNHSSVTKGVWSAVTLQPPSKLLNWGILYPVILQGIKTGFK